MQNILNIILIYAQDYLIQWLGTLAIFIAGIVAIKISNRYVHKIICKIRIEKTLEIFIHKIIKIFLWIIFVILILSNLGVNISAFVAGLGIMGFIIGFATKDVLSNLISGLLILINKPFAVGDFISAAGITGVVKEIGISSCVIISEEKEYVIIPNSKVWGAPIKNISRREK